MKHFSEQVFEQVADINFDNNLKIGDLNSQETDFAAEKNGERLYVEVTPTTNEEKTLE